MRVIFFADIVNDAVAQITEEKGRSRHQKNLLHSLFFRAGAGFRPARFALLRATGAIRTRTSLALLETRTRTAGFTRLARITLVVARYARLTLLFFLYFIHA